MHCTQSFARTFVASVSHQGVPPVHPAGSLASAQVHLRQPGGVLASVQSGGSVVFVVMQLFA